LSNEVNTALENAEFFVLVCSPHSARSDYINEEVRRFMILRGSKRVIPILKDGEPQDQERECFPPALWMGLSGERQEPIYIDGRRTAGIKQIMLRKLVATLLGLTPEDLQNSAQQESQYRRRRVAAAVLMFIAATAALAIAFYERELLASAWQMAHRP
jgi:eukaryotic-like serine/threonine-protein kinase